MTSRVNSLNILALFRRNPGESTMQLPTSRSPLTYETILNEIRLLRADPLAGTGKWSIDEELANHLFKRVKYIDHTKVAETGKPAEPNKPAKLDTAPVELRVSQVVK